MKKKSLVYKLCPVQIVNSILKETINLTKDFLV